MDAKVKRYRKAIKSPFFPYYFGKIKNIFKYIYNIFKNMFGSDSPLYAQGSHIITGYPGSGKTLLMNHIISQIDSDKYFFYTNIDEFSGHDNVYKVELSKIFDNKKQITKLATRDYRGRHLYGLILDEINLNFNRRVNQSKDYNNLFIGLIEMVVTHRHQHIPRIYFIGQKLELQDGQLISLFKYQHDIIRAKKRYRYWKYYKDYAQRIPVKLKIMHRLKDQSDQFCDYAREKVKIRWYDLESYNTFALQSVYSKLNEYKGEYKKPQ